MRILHVVPSYIPAYRYGGPIRSVHGLCKGLAGRGHEVHVFTTNVDGDKDSKVLLEQPVDLDGVKVRYFPSKHLRRIYYAPSLGRALNREIKNFDLVHLHSIFLWPTWAAARTARRENIPYIVTPRGMLVKELIRRKSRFWKTVWINLIEKRNLENAAVIHMTSRIEANDIAQFGFNLNRVRIVPNGVDMPKGFKFSPPLRGGDEGEGKGLEFSQDRFADVSPHVREVIEKGPYLLFLGRVNWKKGLDRLILAMKQISDGRLIIAGNDEEDYRPGIERLVSENGLEGRVVFYGPVYDVDKFALLKSARVFVLPSYSENFGLSVLEAMACGCPVVVTPEVGVAEIVRDSGAGVVINGDPVELGKGIKHLLSDSNQLKDMSERGKKTVAERFTWDVVSKQMEEVYRAFARTDHTNYPDV
ncbi:MAG TPA: glycosyltransferase [Dissulfurispiraceae bacterium]|nr:glycosyltransferase [Dissulfurispiraceae bacterium]